MGQKEALLQGKDYREPVDLSAVEGPPEIFVRPLTEPEAGHIQRIQQKGISAPLDTGAVTVTAVLEDLGDYMSQISDARIQTVAYGLSVDADEIWTAEEVGKLPAKQTRALHVVITRISGMRATTLVETGSEEGSTAGSFPAGSGDDRGAESGGGSGDDDAGVQSSGDAPSQ